MSPTRKHKADAVRCALRARRLRMAKVNPKAQEIRMARIKRQEERKAKA